MQIKFKELQLTNYKSHKDLEVKFGDLTKISGENAQGKSSILEAIVWLLYATDTLGSKTDPTPDTYEAEETFVSLLLEVDGTPTLLGRELKKGKTKYFINEVPKKAIEFNELLDGLFDKDLFLSLFNPSYFFTMHPTNGQRPMLLKYVAAPANKEVFKELPKAQGDKLAALVKKHSLADLEEMHKLRKNKMNKQYIAAQGAVKALKGEMEQYKTLVPASSLRTEKNQLEKRKVEIEKIMNDTADKNQEINAVMARVESLTPQIDRGREQHKKAKEQEIKTTCHACGQELTEEAKTSAEKHKDENVQNIASQVNPLIKERKELREQLKKLSVVEVDEDLKTELNEIQGKLSNLDVEMMKHEQVKGLEERIEKAEAEEKESLATTNESIFILDSIKDFYAKEAELQAKKVQDLFETLSIRLFKEQKNGDIKPDFAIQMDGKDYSKLSLSESIKAGLELREVLSEQSEIVAPTFVDNAESITKFKEPSGQLIMAKVVEGKELEVSAGE